MGHFPSKIIKLDEIFEASSSHPYSVTQDIFEAELLFASTKRLKLELKNACQLSVVSAQIQKTDIYIVDNCGEEDRVTRVKILGTILKQSFNDIKRYDIVLEESGFNKKWRPDEKAKITVLKTIKPGKGKEERKIPSNQVEGLQNQQSPIKLKGQVMNASNEESKSEHSDRKESLDSGSSGDVENTLYVDFTIKTPDFHILARIFDLKVYREFFNMRKFEPISMIMNEMFRDQKKKNNRDGELAFR